MYRVLLVEDEEIIRKGIRYSVPWEECGCSVVGEAEAVRNRTALPPLSEDKVTDPLVLRIVAYLKENYQSKITLADLQEQFHYSERYINQKFQKELGTTVIDYLNRCRIQNALELIRKGKLPISQIGWECGIGEYKYFNHVFKKYIGCSVREYQSTLK